MILYSLRLAFRNLLRFKNHTVTGLTGLIIGLVCVYIITAWTIQELRYDRFHKQAESVYMVITEMKDSNGNPVPLAETPPVLAQSLKENVPGIENSFHFLYLYGGRLIETKNSSFEETGIAADKEMLKVLNFPLTEGDISFLDDPGSIFLTEKLAVKLFPNEKPIGEEVVFNNEKVLTVKGVLKEIPENSSLKFDFIVPYQIVMGAPTSWWPLSDATFVKLAPDADAVKIKQLSVNVWERNVSNKQFSINFVPLTKFRYGAGFQAFNAQHGNFLKLYSFIGIALLILIIASLNYTNLISAYSIKRAGEVSVRKVNGASTNSILKYFLAESVLHSVIAGIAAIFLSFLCVRFFQQIVDVTISSKYLIISCVLGVAGAVIIIGFLSGLYPALIASKFLPFFEKQGQYQTFRPQKKLRSVFIFGQFVLSITLTIICLVIIRQTRYMDNFDVGYNPDDVVHVFIPQDKFNDFESIRNSLLSDANITQVSYATVSPVDLHPFFATPDWKWDGLKDEKPASIYSMDVDQNYLDVFQIPLLKGRFFSASQADFDKVVINEKMAALSGFDDPVGRILWQGNKKFEIIGVVKNFHFQNLANTMQPLLFRYSDTKNRMFVKINGNTEAGVNAIRNQFVRITDKPFSYSFVDDELRSLYKNEGQISIGIIVFTILAIFLSCIGLLGLVTLNTKMKIKEIGIRKVCGAKISEVVVFLNRGLILWFLAGSLISSVIAYIITDKWLENFAFRVHLSWWIFILAMFLVFTITTITVSWQTINAARTNPADSLKYE